MKKLFLLTILLFSQAAYADSIGIYVPPLFVAVVEQAQNWTIAGKSYHNVIILSHDSKSVTIHSNDGVGTFALSDLSPDLQKKVNDDVATVKAAADTTATNAVPPATQTATTPMATSTDDSSSNHDEISGAFGIKLGDVVDPASANVVGTTKDGTPQYQFTPVNGLSSLTDYYVLITPETHKIFAVCASGSFDSPELAKNEQAVIMHLLVAKYGPIGEQAPDDIVDNTQHIVKDSRGVLTMVIGFTTATLSLQYIDLHLAQVAQSERIDTEAKKTDAGGL
jgi:hypothetical protein